MMMNKSESPSVVQVSCVVEVRRASVQGFWEHGAFNSHFLVSVKAAELGKFVQPKAAMVDKS